MKGKKVHVCADCLARLKMGQSIKLKPKTKPKTKPKKK